MTTPAVSIDNPVFAPANICVQSWTTSGGDGPWNCTLFGNVLAGWEAKSRPASGTSPFTGRFGWRNCRPWNHSGRTYTRSHGTNQLDVSYGTYGSRTRYDESSFWAANAIPDCPAVPASVVNRAEIQALLKLKHQDFHLGNFIAEFDQTRDLVIGAVNTIAHQVRAYRRSSPGKWLEVKKWERGGCDWESIRRIPRDWLQLQYGWKPLMSDVLGAINHLGRPQPPVLVSVKGYADDRDEVSKVYTSIDGSSTCKVKGTVQFQAWVRLYYSLQNAHVAQLSSLGLVNPAEIVWEKLPYSFVVDWFMPVGNWLSSLTADAGFSFQGGSLSKMSKMGDLTSAQPAYPNSPGAIRTGPGISWTGDSFVFDRSCYSDTPVPGVYVKNPLSAVHVANALALLVTAFDR